VREPSRHVFKRNRRERLAYDFVDRLAGARSGLPHDVLYFGESFPTFICVVQTHILDDAHGAEDGLRMLAARWLSRNSPSAPMETPTADRDRREEVAK
jgi:hypothetical protein